MIHFFNRRELIATFQMEEQARIRTVLHDAGIEYSVKTVNRTGASPLSAGTRGRTGSLGSSMKDMYEYIIYVHKDDYEKARLVAATK